MKSISVLFLLSLFLVIAGCTSEQAGEMEQAQVQNDGLTSGDRIVFFGDSITQQGAQPGGYVNLVADSIHSVYPDLGIEVIGAGISGNKVPDLLARVEQDVLSKNPTKVVVYIGINDVWHWENFSRQGTTKEDFAAGLRTLIDTLQQANASVILTTPSVIGEKVDGTNPQDDMLEEYAQISRDVAIETGAELLDLRQAFLDYLKENNPENVEQGILTTDGVHLNEAGNRFVAELMFTALAE